MLWARNGRSVANGLALFHDVSRRLQISQKRGNLDQAQAGFPGQGLASCVLEIEDGPHHPQLAPGQGVHSFINFRRNTRASQA